MGVFRNLASRQDIIMVKGALRKLASRQDIIILLYLQGVSDKLNALLAPIRQKFAESPQLQVFFY